MQNYLALLLLFSFAAIPSFSQQQTFRKGSFYSLEDSGKRMKLNLLDDNKFEMIWFYGDYEIKNDSLILKNRDIDKSVFEVEYLKNKKTALDKIKINFGDDSLYGIYIGTQNGTDPVHYQKVSDLVHYKEGNDACNQSFEINRVQYLYFVNEGFDFEPREIVKYEIPKAITEVKVHARYDFFSKLQLKGFYDKNTDLLMIGETKDNSAVFHNEEPQIASKESLIPPLEIKRVATWTYPGKAAGDYDGERSVSAPLDSTEVSNRIQYKLKIEKTFPEALQRTKNEENKFLAVYYDDNKDAQEDFNHFIERLEQTLSYYFTDSYDARYDLYNYYFATEEDVVWLKKNKIKSPAILLLDRNGTILASAESKLTQEKIDKFTFYDSFNGKLKTTYLKNNFARIVNNSNSTDSELVKAYYDISALGSIGDYDYEYSEEYANNEDFKFIKFDLHSKKAQQVWKKIIENHKKDTEPNMHLAVSIIQEIRGVGYTKQIFLEDKVLSDTDFESIDYLIKHCDAINAKREEYNNSGLKAQTQIQNVISEISNALQNSTRLYNDKEKQEVSNQKKVKETYEKTLLINNGNFEFYRNYFQYLADNAETGSDKKKYIEEFAAYFSNNFGIKEQLIQNLDQMFDVAFDANSLYYHDWKEFKEYHSNLFNEAAWSAAVNLKDPVYIKKAINWSECSLILSKNNPYYLDTLAQLYYKDGQKDKAIATQTLAVKYLSDAVEEETASEIKDVLSKMKNGTY
ncbi:hypothetical protein [Flavobacterium gelatinilyticum]|mgnify:CR=1 FL=1|uniref:hypothetical protein n=1 Tax=Flavobacterium gelatinilyticum TaxID=3003260 RepID=UPI00247FF20F|nr:hypothetical protein [Flavobacterium gelatinilyticum]